MSSSKEPTPTVRTLPATMPSRCLACEKLLPPQKRPTANPRRYCDARCRRQASRERQRLRLFAALIDMLENRKLKVESE